MSSLQQNWRRGQNRFCLEARNEEREGAGCSGEMAQAMYEHMHNVPCSYSAHENQQDMLELKELREFSRKSTKKFRTCSKHQGGPSLGHYIYIQLLIELYRQNQRRKTF
jgi:hypothetical protein